MDTKPTPIPNANKALWEKGDFTRIAASNPDMWRDISLANRDVLLQELARYREHLDRLSQLISQQDGPQLEDFFRVAREARRDWTDNNTLD